MRIQIRRFRQAAVVSCLPFAFAAAAHAQSTESPVTVEEVVVTGEKINRSLQETVTSVAVTTAQRIEEENLLTLQEVYDRTANVSETYGAAGFTIRGIANNGVSGAGNAPLSTVYLDGAPLPTTLLYGAPTNVWDVAQVEILRGPQSTLQGLNTLAGAVILRTTDPGDEWNGRARVYATDEDETVYSAAIGGPVVEDQLGIRLAAEYRDFDGYITNVTRDAPEDPIEVLNVRGVIDWAPTAIEGFDARLSFTHSEREGGYSFNYADMSEPDYFHHRVNYSDAANTADVDVDLASLELKYEVSERIGLRSTTTYNSATEVTAYDSDSTAADLGSGVQTRDYDTFSQEFRLDYRTEGMSGVLGLFYYQRDQVFTNDAVTYLPTPIDTIAGVLEGNGLDPATSAFIAQMYGAALPMIGVDYTSNSPSDVETYALFGDGRLALTDRLDLVAGFRWDRETNETQTAATSAFTGTYPNPSDFAPPGDPLWFAIAGINQAVAQYVAQAGATTPNPRRTFDEFLPKLGLRYEMSPDASVGFVVQRGYRSGGSSENIARATIAPYDPEYTWNYELSLRTQWLDRRLTLNANAFYVDWKDQQVTVNFGLNVYDTQTVNAGRSHLYGFEVELSHQLTNDIDWYLSLGHVETQFDQFDTVTGAVNDLSGQEFPYAPSLTLGGGLNVRFANAFTANLNANYRSEVFTDVTADQDQSLYQVGSRVVANARVSYDAGHWALSLFSNNLFDEEYAQYESLATDMAVLGAPRTVGVILEAKF